MNKEEKLTRSRLRTSYFTTVVSISLVMFLLGLIGLLILNAQKLSDYVKENIGFTVVLKDNAKEVDVRQLQKDLDATEYVKMTQYVTKEEAAKILQSDLGEDFVDFLGYNPLSESIEVKLKADYANPDSIARIEKEFTASPIVKEVFYQKSLLHLVNENVRKISMILFIFSALLFIISFALINNTIRLAVYSKRFIIYTMQLVGATRGFVRLPFIISSLIQGFIGASISIFLLIGVIYIAQKEVQEIISLQDFDTLAVLFLFVVIFGMLISWISTFFAVNKYLNINPNKLYY